MILIRTAAITTKVYLVNLVLPVETPIYSTPIKWSDAIKASRVSDSLFITGQKYLVSSLYKLSSHAI